LNIVIHPLLLLYFEKKTFAGLLTNDISFAPFSYQLGLVRTLVDRVYKINNTWLGFHGVLKKLTMILRKNCFPIWVIDKIIHSYVSKKMNANATNVWTGLLSSDGTSTHFCKLPYVGRFSKAAQIKLRQLLKHYCKTDLDITLVFSTFKFRNMFKVKDSVPQSLRLRVIYKFTRAGCNACYIGETTCHVCTGVHKYLVSDKASHVY